MSPRTSLVLLVTLALPLFAVSLTRLGWVLQAQGKFDEARACFEEALAIRRKALPKDHTDIAQSLYSLGAVQCTLQQYAAAKASHQEALVIRRKTLSPRHADVVASLNYLGVVRCLEEYAAAKMRMFMVPMSWAAQRWRRPSKSVEFHAGPALAMAVGLSRL